MDQSAAHDLSVLEGPNRPEWAPKELNGRHLLMCEYHLSGMTNKEIGTLLGYHHVHVGVVLRSPAAKKYIDTRVQDLDAELHGMYHQVVSNFREALADESVDVRMRATEMWLKTHGRFARAGGVEKGGKVSAEEVVRKLLERVSQVNINIDNRQVHNHEHVEPPPRTEDDFSFLEDKSE